MSDQEKVFTSYDIQACLYDKIRVGYFQQAIAEIVKPGDVVVDGGSGTGLLGMLAARAGAKKVYCIEINKDYVHIIEEHAKRNGMKDQIVAVQGDATTVDLPERVDVIISEVISAGFFYEPQLQIITNLQRFLKPGGVVIPFAMNNSVELIKAQEMLYGLRFNYDTRFRSLKDVALTSRGTYLKTEFHEPLSHFVAERGRVRGVRSGTANAVRVAYEIKFTEAGRWRRKPTEFLLNPQIIFLDELFPVRRGERYDVSLSYESSTDPRHCKITIERARPS